MLAMASLTVATGCVLAGAWLVLPYSVLEVTVLAAAFAYIERRARDWERVTVSGDRVVVERRRGRRYERREWNRPWVQVTEVGESTRGALLRLRCAGESWNFGAALAAEERRAVARSLRQLISPRPELQPDRLGRRQG